MAAGPEVLRATRLARAIASDLAVYHPEAVVRGVAEDAFFEALGPQLAEGLALYRSRVEAALDPEARHYWQAVVDIMLAGTGRIDSPMW